VKAIYQRYLGWYDGNSAQLWQHPPEAAGARYVRAIGGIDAAVATAREFADEGDLRFAAELASHAVFAEPDHTGAKDLLADVLTRLGYGSECATWRNNFLVGASEVDGPPHPAEVSAAGMAAALTVTQVFDSIAIRIDGPRAWGTSATIRWHFTDEEETYRMELSNGVLIHYPTGRSDPADLVVTLTPTRPSRSSLRDRGRRYSSLRKCSRPSPLGGWRGAAGARPRWRRGRAAGWLEG